ncbi:hypothetical protein [Christensenella tenuis]|uniref:Uncharacterized protein n=1 Tax=Christensenella tenuis TaxID=2763033 RepID=A0ABR7EH86_9FIRM|nr:hypothetical protein [Christensenella tenuis]MBC5648399.1 hypothetical protein [Christensenella tenuis]
MYMRPSRRKKRRRLTNLIILIAVIAAAAAGVFFLLANFTDIELFSPLLKETETVMPENVQANENGILYEEDGTLYLKDQKGAALWDLKLEPAGSKYTQSPTLICTWAQANLQALSYTKEQLFTAAVASEIMDVRCGKETIAVLTGAADESGQTLYYLTLFNSKGEQAGQVEFKTRQVIDFGFSGDSDMLWSLSLDTSNVVPVSYISTYKSDGSPTSSIENNTQVIEHVYVTSDTIFASGTNNLFSYNYFGEKQGEALVYGWKPEVWSIGGTTLELAYVPRGSEASLAAAKLFSGDLAERILYLPQNAFAIAVTQNQFYVYTPNAVMTYDLSGGLVKTTKLDYTLTAAKQLSDTLAVCWDKEGKSYLMQLN